MAGLLGRNFLLKLDTDLIAGLRTTSLTINDQTVDVTSKDSDGFRELLAGTIVQSMTVSGAGSFRDDATIADIRDAMLAGTHETYSIVVPGTATAGGTYTGAFRITSLEESGNHDGDVQYSITLESDGEIAFTEAT